MDEAGTWYGGRPQPSRLCVRWGPSPPQKKGVEPPPQFSAHFHCGHVAGCIKMQLGMEAGLSSEAFVFDGYPAPSQKRGRRPQFSECLLRSNGCMDQDATWYGGRPQLKLHCVRWGPSSPSTKVSRAPILGLCLLWPDGWMD